MNNDLKSCPFCGNDMVRVINYVNFVGKTIHAIECKKCHAIIDFTEWDEYGEPLYKTKDEVITAWNSRTSDKIESIKPCICGSHNIVIADSDCRNTYYKTIRYFLLCTDCLQVGAPECSKELAISNWNQMIDKELKKN